MQARIGIAAYSGEPPRQAVEKALIALDSLIEECRRASARLVAYLGGFRGLMRIAASRLLTQGATIVLILPRDYEGIDEPEEAIVVRTGMDSKARSAIIVRSSDALLVLGGASGTILEAFAAYGLGRPVVYLIDTGLESDRLVKAYADGVLDARIGRAIHYTSEPREAGKLACRLALDYEESGGSR